MSDAVFFPGRPTQMGSNLLKSRIPPNSEPQISMNVSIISFSSFEQPIGILNFYNKIFVYLLFVLLRCSKVFSIFLVCLVTLAYFDLN